MSRVSPIIAILGGTFDPIHYGHLRLGADVKSAVGLDEVRLVPAGDPPHRAPPVASAEHRLAMTELGCAEFSGLIADAREVHRPGPSYTVLTLESLREEQRGRPLALVIGADAFAGLEQWRRWQQLFTLAHFLVVERPGTAFDPATLPATLRTQWERRLTTDAMRLERSLAGAILRVDVTPQPISASSIRAALARGPAGRSTVRGLLPASVLAYIDRNQLYRSDQDAT
ncbi:MAG TPA: nicotinate-nucleotide adenylyltransferase [Casimicrobiaceae bacterium]|nr:nicotinate-nucleotide adenylyltransferase [Casimicrobiaceae bacterium]